MSENTLKIKVTIANRTYPLTIKREEEEQIRAAVKTINDAVARFESRYAVQDKQDVLSMCALQLASKSEIALKQSQDVQSQASKALADVEAALDAVVVMDFARDVTSRPHLIERVRSGGRSRRHGKCRS